MIGSGSADTTAVSFGIPFYRGLDYLGHAIRSVLAQSDPNWRAFVCDDGDEPGVEALVGNVGEGRVAYVKNPARLGIGGNFNRCLELAGTDLVTILHADDELEPNYAGAMRARASANPGAAALFCNVSVIGDRGQPRFSLPDAIKRFIHPAPGREFALAGEPGVRALIRGNFIMAPTLCFRKSVLGERGFPEQYAFVLDLELTTSLLLDGDTLIGLPERLYRYRRHDDNATARLTRSQQRFLEESAFYDRMLAEAGRRGWTECVRLARQKRMLKFNLTYRTLASVAHGRLADARRGFELLSEI